ncbi:MAG: D5 family helicase-primase [Dasosvirus sp.]|uniref:D5 family helicase-primase n=1 Tax=Dasosvirus sp. TaxID=2487764 RepID=A0A3G4ZW07_9VIRU|nr:MAG: D5 family helicase-primase [Dasosvirus sp.]
MKKYMSENFYDLLLDVMYNLYGKDIAEKRKKILSKLKTTSDKQRIIATYREYGPEKKIIFDNKRHLLGFDNRTYDLQKNRFKQCKYDDYILTTTNYDWVNPLDEKIDNINNLISTLIPDNNEKELFLRVLSTCLSGNHLEETFFLTGDTDKIKIVNDLLLKALGNYATSYTNFTSLSEHNSQIRLVVIRYIHKNKLKSLIQKIITEYKIIATIIIECDYKPEDIEKSIELRIKPNNIDCRKISHCTEYDEQQHNKCALIKILMDAYQRYINNDCVLE